MAEIYGTKRGMYSVYLHHEGSGKECKFEKERDRGKGRDIGTKKDRYDILGKKGRDLGRVRMTYLRQLPLQDRKL